MPSKSSQTHPDMLPFLHASSEIIQIQHKSTYICPLNKSTVILSSHPKSTLIRSNLLKSAQIHRNRRIHEKSNNSNQIPQTKSEYSQTYPNPRRSAKSLKSCKICPDQQKNTKFQQNRCKSPRSVLSLKSSRGH